MKNTIATITLAMVLTLGATSTFANGGIIVSDRQAPATECTAEKDGIIVFGRDGIIVFGKLIWGTADTTPCTTEAGKGGIIVGD